ncbi:hypothetical protein G9A89_003782 [Geosiphon pyriformis]|nr:hypothetical protein G9A89_003782 [Geosiphon pyriformis]
MVSFEVDNENHMEENVFSAIKDRRPNYKWRNFKSWVIDGIIQDFQKRMKDKDLAQLFANCWPNTLDRFIRKINNNQDTPRTFVVPGGIEVMFLRDSTMQVLSYVPYISKDSDLKNMILGVINLQAEYILENPYANSFYAPDDSGISRPYNPWYNNDISTPQRSELTWQVKWQVDSLASFLKLSYNFWVHTKDESLIFNITWRKAVRKVLATLRDQQSGTIEEFENVAYSFSRESRNPGETLSMGGIGMAVTRAGLIKSQFRSSDDSTTFPFIISSNAMIAVELEHVQEVLVKNDPKLADELGDLAIEIRKAIQDYGVVNHKKFGKIYAYETDGFGSVNLMDDAAIPSLISLPYLGFVDVNEPTYQNTRKFVLSEFNKYFFDGQFTTGIGSQHTGLGYVWPISICMRILTSTDDDEIKSNLDQIKLLSLSSGLIHEATWYNDTENRTREWFGAANSLFGEVILKVAHERPHLIFSENYLPSGIPVYIPGFLILIALVIFYSYVNARLR